MGKLKQNSNQAVSFSGEYIRNNPSILQTDLYCLGPNEYLYKYGLKFLVRKDFQLIEELNEFIGMAGRSGLLIKWLKHGNSLSHREIREDQKIKSESMYGVLLIVFSLFAFAKLIFIFELVIYKFVNRPNPSNFWLIAQVMISPDRHVFLQDLRY